MKPVARVVVSGGGAVRWRVGRFHKCGLRVSEVCLGFGDHELGYVCLIVGCGLMVGGFCGR